MPTHRGQLVTGIGVIGLGLFVVFLLIFQPAGKPVSLCGEVGYIPVSSIQSMPDGTLWISSENTSSDQYPEGYMRAGQVTLVQYIPRYEDRQPFYLIGSAEGDLYALTREYLARCQIEGEDLPVNPSEAIVDDDGNIWVSARGDNKRHGGLFRFLYNPDGAKAEGMSVTGNDSSVLQTVYGVTGLSSTHGDSVVALTHEGAWVVSEADGPERDLVSYGKRGAGSQLAVVAIHEDSHGNTWTLHPNGGVTLESEDNDTYHLLGQQSQAGEARPAGSDADSTEQETLLVLNGQHMAGVVELSDGTIVLGARSGDGYVGGLTVARQLSEDVIAYGSLKADVWENQYPTEVFDLELVPQGTSALYPNPDNEVWVASEDKGVQRMTIEDSRTKVEVIVSEPTYDITFNEEGEGLLIGLDNGVLYVAQRPLHFVPRE